MVRHPVIAGELVGRLLRQWFGRTESEEPTLISVAAWFAAFRAPRTNCLNRFLDRIVDTVAVLRRIERKISIRCR
ncbi:hypothetical protein, partial [Nevskia ramosa]|uniref:hypothetical protein n=1 Tax=Nevskia ramosa TaxID=64002 RepID=UPI0023533599